MSNVPVFDQISTTAIMKPKSPKRVTMNAFFAAAAALGRWNQNPMSRYEVRPTSSQWMKSIRRLWLITRPSMAAVNSDMKAKNRG